MPCLEHFPLCSVADVDVDGGGRNRTVTKQRLDKTQVDPFFQEHRCESVAEHAWHRQTAHALELTCRSLDYRYLDAGDERKTREIQPPEHIRLACLEYMLREKAQFVGFDFRVDAATGDWWLLEANPMPGFDFYDRLVDWQISLLVKKLLTGEIPSLEAEVIGQDQGAGIISVERLPRVSG